jgi:hypothetical protein
MFREILRQSNIPKIQTKKKTTKNRFELKKKNERKMHKMCKMFTVKTHGKIKLHCKIKEK